MSLSKFLAVSALFFSAVAHAELLELRPERVDVDIDPASRQEVVSVHLTPESRAALAAYTRERVGKTIEIRVAGERILAPTLRGAIDTGDLWFSPGPDGFSGRSARELAEALRQAEVMLVSEPEPEPRRKGAVGMPNPASAYCIAQGGKLNIVDEAGGQVGYCTLPSGERVEEWELFRREHPQPDAASS